MTISCKSQPYDYVHVIRADGIRHPDDVNIYPIDDPMRLRATAKIERLGVAAQLVDASAKRDMLAAAFVRKMAR